MFKPNQTATEKTETLSDDVVVEMKQFKRQKRIEKIQTVAAVTGVIVIASVIAWKLDPINRGLAKAGIELPNE